MTNIEQIESALSHIHSDDRDTWLQVGMAIQSELGDAGFHLWNSWSQSADSYNFRDAESTWKSFTPSGGVGIGSVFYLAGQNGWENKAYTTLTHEEKAHYKANMKAAKQQREVAQEKVHAECRKKSEKIWSQAERVTEHEYLQSKGVKSYGLKIYKGALIVPLRDIDGTLHGLQFISISGEKKFKNGTCKKGHYHSIGGKPETVLCLAEGYATAATIHEATGDPVAICFDAGNLMPVAVALKGKHQNLKLVVCADNDRHTDGNQGLTKATEAARVINGLVAVPEFPTDSSGTDFNDLATATDLEEVRRQIVAAKQSETLAGLATLAVENEQLPLRRELPRSDPFPLDALPTSLRGMAEKIIETIQPPVALVGQSMLAAASLAVQSLADVSIDGRRFPLSCFFITIGESGERKSATDNAVLAPHRKHERNLIDAAKDAGHDYLAALEEWKKSKELILKKGENIKQNLLALGQEPLAPLVGQLVTEEPTYEGIFKLLQLGKPSIGIFSAEGGRFIGGHAMSKDNQLKTATGLSSLWDGSPMTRTRSGDGSNTLYGRRCSLHLMLQPNIASDLFSNNLLIGQGLLSRCLATYPESTIGNRPYRETDISQTVEGKEYASTIMRLLEMPQPIAENQRNELCPRELFLEPAAKSDWVAYHDHIESLMQRGGDLSSVRGFAAKSAEHAARLAGILALVETPSATTISQYAIQAGIELSQFYIGEALRLFHSSNDDQDLILAEECLNWAAHKGGLFSLPCLYQNGPSRVRNKKTAKHIVDLLEQHHRVIRVEGGGEIDGVRRRDVWEVTV